jgi:hypothetical protein
VPAAWLGYYSNRVLLLHDWVYGPRRALTCFSSKAAHPGRARPRGLGSLLQGGQQGGIAVRGVQGAGIALVRQVAPGWRLPRQEHLAP